MPNCRNYKKEACVSYREIRKIIAMSLQLLRAPHNIPRTLMAGLRHTHAAILSSIGVQIVDVSKRLGHTNTRITQEIYEYYFRSSDKGVSDKLEKFYEDITNCSQNVVKKKSNA